MGPDARIPVIFITATRRGRRLARRSWLLSWRSGGPATSDLVPQLLDRESSRCGPSRSTISVSPSRVDGGIVELAAGPHRLEPGGARAAVAEKVESSPRS